MNEIRPDLVSPYVLREIDQGLDPRPARPMTSREIAKVLGSILGGLRAWNNPAEIKTAIEHVHENRDVYAGVREPE